MGKRMNVGKFDQVVRFILGALLIAAPYFTASVIWDEPLFRWGLPIVGLVLVATAFLRFCLIYRYLGVNTCPAVK